MEMGLRYFYHPLREHRATRHSVGVSLSSATEARHRRLGTQRRRLSRLQKLLLVRLFRGYHEKKTRAATRRKC